MTNRTLLLLLIVLTLPSSKAGAQEETVTSPPERASEQPIALNGQRPLLNIKSLRPNSFSTGVDFETMFDDNPLWSTTDKHSNVSQVLLPYVNIRHSASRLNWDAWLVGMVVNNRQLKSANGSGEDFQLDLSYGLAPHLTLRGSSEVANTTGMFGGFDSPMSGSGIGLIEQPNNALFIPADQRTVWTSNLVELSDQTSPGGTLGVRGIYSRLNYPSVPKDAPFGLYDNQSYAGEIFYNHQLSAKHWGGVMLRSEELDTQTQPSVRVDGAMLLYGFNPTRSITLSLFAGPEHLDAPPIFTRNQRWIPAGGGSFIWQGKQIGALAEFFRGISDGGGLSSPTIAQIENLELWRPVGKRRELEFGLTHSRGDLLSTGENSFSTLVTVQFEQPLVKNLTAKLGYAREGQRYPNGLGTANANRGWITLSYGITRPLGR
ncbi:MAG: hypothetical protein JO356_02015 [Acidobacteria bacterium]|nr:hypothetical protein [Acidobacteriota bacterium]